MRRVVAQLIFLFVMSVAACAAPPSTPAPLAPPKPQEAGYVVSHIPLPGVDPSLVDEVSWAQLVTYISHNAVTDSAQETTASIYVPKGPPPPGGFPIVALDRPFTGMGSGCISSSDTVDSSPTIGPLLRAGYVVVVPDYLGLGHLSLGQPSDDEELGFHPFLDSTTAAENTIDAVRATRDVVKLTSVSWVVLGSGEGGQAAWAANEIAEDYGYGSTLRGAAGISPAADIEGLADAAASGTLDAEQELAYISYLDALGKEYPDDFHMDDYRRGIVSQNWDLLLSCGGDRAAERASAESQITPDDVRPATPAALAALHGYLQKTSLPQGPMRSPMLVLFGTQDPLIPADWTQRALDRACAMGDTIAIQRQTADSSPDIDPATALPWIAERFAGAPAPNDCRPASTPSPVGAPEAAPPLPVSAPAQPHPPLGIDPHTDASLISGWLPIVIQVVTFSALVAATGWRSRLWRLRWLPIAAVVGVVVAAAAYWYVHYQGWGNDPPGAMWAWIALTGFATAVLVAGWPSAPWWRRAVSVMSVLLAAISAADVLNVSLGYLPTVRAAWEMATGVRPPNWVDESRLADMVREGVRPSSGTIVSVKIHDDKSGFIHRDEFVYLPPAWFESSPPPRLPTIMMIGAEMGGPRDWISAGTGDAERTLDEFALKNRDTSPVIVFPDSSGSFDNDTECVNGPRGNAADHLTKEVVPYVVSHFGTIPEAKGWGVAGWSTGGTCALTLSVMHPELFSAFVDLDGDLRPNAGDEQQTVARLFGGDSDGWAAFDPKSVVEAHGRYSDLSAWFGVSDQTPTTYRSGVAVAATSGPPGELETASQNHADTANQLCRLLSAHAIDCAVSSYSGSHDFPSAGHGFAAALPWLAGKIGTPGSPKVPLPGGPD